MCFVNFPAFPEVLFTHVSEVQSAKASCLINTQAKWVKAWWTFPGRRVRVSSEPYLHLAVFPGPTLSLPTRQLRENLCNFSLAKTFRYLLFQPFRATTTYTHGEVIVEIKCHLLCQRTIHYIVKFSGFGEWGQTNIWRWCWLLIKKYESAIHLLVSSFLCLV